MATQRLDRAEWNSYFDDFSRTLIGTRRTDYAEIRVLMAELGAQTETEWLPLTGITYDPQEDLLDIAVESLDHRISQPSDIFVEEEEGVIEAIEVITRDGTCEITELR